MPREAPRRPQEAPGSPRRLWEARCSRCSAGCSWFLCRWCAKNDVFARSRLPECPERPQEARGGSRKPQEAPESSGGPGRLQECFQAFADPPAEVLLIRSHVNTRPLPGNCRLSRLGAAHQVSRKHETAARQLQIIPPRCCSSGLT